MNKTELELEAEKYADYSNDYIPISYGAKFNESHKKTFIAGATSKYVEKQKLEFAIEQLKYVKKMYPCTDKEECVNVRIKELEQQLNNL